MAKEVLVISPQKVVVDYDFRNDTNEDVITEVAFPVPPYTNGTPETLPAEQSFDNFRVWVDGKPVSYETQVTATLKEKDVTAILRADRIDIQSFGHYYEAGGVNRTHDFERLSESEQKRLVNEGLFDSAGDVYSGLWTVHIQYYWSQRFPAHSTIHIRHEYVPRIGAGYYDSATDVLHSLATDTPISGTPGAKTENDWAAEIASFCPAKPLLRDAEARFRESQSDPEEQKNISADTFEPRWVNFILTTANTWKKPIEDFTLIVERGDPIKCGKLARETYVSLCAPQNGKVEELDANRFQVHITDFVPSSELHIGYFDLPVVKRATSVQTK